jgi:hypothetical protein
VRSKLVVSIVWGALLALGGCYNQPEIPRERPLRCSSNAPGECPTGFLCVGNRICAPTNCRVDTDCPEGLTCGARVGCVPLANVTGRLDGGASDGASAGATADGGLDASGGN